MAKRTHRTFTARVVYEQDGKRVVRESDGRESYYVATVNGLELPQWFDRQFDAEQAANAELYRQLGGKAAA